MTSTAPQTVTDPTRGASKSTLAGRILQDVRLSPEAKLLSHPLVWESQDEICTLSAVELIARSGGAGIITEPEAHRALAELEAHGWITQAEHNEAPVYLVPYDPPHQQ